jgi:tRNA 2-thiouridine synthesizing protein A
MHSSRSSFAHIVTESHSPRLIDARHLACPQPVLMLRQALRTLTKGDCVSLLTTDPMASVDVRAFCLRAGHHLRSESDAGDHAVFSVERG